jgi:hypothetical protein
METSFGLRSSVRFWAYSVEKLDAVAPSVASFEVDFELFRALRLGGGGD